ncbi:MAG: hypothetical protein GY679_01295 [Mycoplasma sp.]|nr:hypothetical protein [Mycoplasma sp.]
MAETFYLKKQKDVDSDGNHLYNIANSLLVDEIFRSMSLGKSRRKHELKKLIGNGQKIIESPFRNPQTISGSIKYFSYNNSDNSFNEVRREFLRDWAYTEDEVYLYRKEDDRLTRRKVILDVDGSEEYNYYPIAEDIKFIMLSEKPFFDNVTSESEAYTKTSSTVEIPITNNGEFTPFVVNFTLGGGASFVTIKTFENRAVKIEYSFISGSELQVDMTDLTIYINGIERTNLSVTGSPFNLSPGDNTVKIISAAPGTGIIEYSERYT